MFHKIARHLPIFICDLCVSYEFVHFNFWLDAVFCCGFPSGKPQECHWCFTEEGHVEQHSDDLLLRQWGSREPGEGCCQQLAFAWRPGRIGLGLSQVVLPSSSPAKGCGSPLGLGCWEVRLPGCDVAVSEGLGMVVGSQKSLGGGGDVAAVLYIHWHACESFSK